MAADCLFCKIAGGAIPSHKVHEDASTFAFLDIKPLRPGHVLVVPKAHAARVEDLTPEQGADLWRAVQRIVPAATRAARAVATTIAVNNGREAGQEVAHVHVHIVPRAPADGGGPVHALFPQRPTLSDAELSMLARDIRQELPAATAARR